jgi:hypothetical protein
MRGAIGWQSLSCFQLTTDSKMAVVADLVLKSSELELAIEQ